MRSDGESAIGCGAASPEPFARTPTPRQPPGLLSFRAGVYFGDDDQQRKRGFWRVEATTLSIPIDDPAIRDFQGLLGVKNVLSFYPIRNICEIALHKWYADDAVDDVHDRHILFIVRS